MSPILSIGKLDRRITIQQLVQGVGVEYGEPTESWADWATVWANVYPANGREFQDAAQMTAEADTQFQIRWVEGLEATMRISYDGRLYDIYRIDEVGRYSRLNIWAKARQA